MYARLQDCCDIEGLTHCKIDRQTMEPRSKPAADRLLIRHDGSPERTSHSNGHPAEIPKFSSEPGGKAINLSPDGPARPVAASQPVAPRPHIPPLSAPYAPSTFFTLPRLACSDFFLSPSAATWSELGP